MTSRLPSPCATLSLALISLALSACAQTPSAAPPVIARKPQPAPLPAAVLQINTQPGDGRRFAGRGLIQTTGRANYGATRDGLRQFMPDVPDFEAMPQLLEQAEWAALSAAWYWHSKGLNALADVGDFKRICLRVNGGTNGMADRLALWAKAKEVLEVKA